MAGMPTALLAFAAHPDDLEFGAGGILFQHARAHRVHAIVCSQGEAASNGTPEGRAAEAREAAKILGMSLEFVPLDGDAHLQATPAHAITLAGHIRTHKPAFVLAPTLVENQHPDHAALGRVVRDACRLARYGGLAELRHLGPHTIGALFHYAITAEGEPRDQAPLLIDVSAAETLGAWTAAMNAHASQLATRGYVETALARARVHGFSVNVSHALPLYPAGPLLVDLAALFRKE